MSEAFLLAGGRVDPDGEGFGSWLRGCKVSPDWLAEIDHVSAQKRSFPGAFVHHWPVGASETQRLLNALIHEIEMDQVELLAFLQADGESEAGLLIGSPAALGRRNLLPLARLAGFSIPIAALVDEKAVIIQKKLVEFSLEAKNIIQMSSPPGSDDDWQDVGKSLNPAIQFSRTTRLITDMLEFLAKANQPGTAGLFLRPSAGLATMVESI